jgi:hypothetical protein
LNTVIENGLLIKTADPGKMGLINIFCHLFHSYSGMTIAQIIYINWGSSLRLILVKKCQRSNVDLTPKF